MVRKTPLLERKVQPLTSKTKQFHLNCLSFGFPSAQCALQQGVFCTHVSVICKAPIEDGVSVLRENLTPWAELLKAWLVLTRVKYMTTYRF